MKSKKYIIHVLSLLFVVTLLISCIPKEDDSKEMSFSLLFPDIEMNNNIKFSESREKFHIGDRIFVDLVNYSDKKIVFPFETLMYTYENGNWINIKDGFIYPQEGMREIEPKESNKPGIITVVGWPQIQDKNLRSIRVVVIGTLVEGGNSTNEKAGAYIDIPLIP